MTFNLIFLGAPGAGKGTQASIIASKFSLTKLSTGDMLRSTVSQGGILGSQLSAIMSSGALVPDSLITQMISDKLDNVAGGVVFDGFPRTLVQAQDLNKLLENKGKNIKIVFEIKVDDAALVDRIACRFSCSKCGESYNSKFKPCLVSGVCDRCGATNFVVREDDAREIVEARLNHYYRLTEPLYDFYRQKNLLHTISGVGSIDDITMSIANVLSPQDAH
jgi:adenylate kinase